MDACISEPKNLAQTDGSRIGRGNAPSLTHRRASRSLALIVAVFLATACLCVGVGSVASIGVFLAAETLRVERVLDRFMRAVANRDAATAYEMFASDSLQCTRAQDLTDLFRGNNYALFQGYGSITLTDVQFIFQPSVDPEYPQGLVATASGVVTYSDGLSGSLDAVLEMEEGTWRIWAIHVTVPPDKMLSPTQLASTLVVVDTGKGRCYTNSDYLPDTPSRCPSRGPATWSGEAGRRGSFADRLTVGPSFARSANLSVSIRQPSAIYLRGGAAQSSIFETCRSGSDPTIYYNRIVKDVTLGPCQAHTRISARS